MLPSVNYLNVASPIRPMANASSKATKTNVNFSGSVGHEPDVFDYILSSQPKTTPSSCTRLDIQA
jgi:hypothetical protein